MADLGKLARDAGYVALGFALLRVQRAQVRRRELEQRAEAHIERISRLLAGPKSGPGRPAASGRG